MFELLKSFCDLTGPSGYEDAVQDVVESTWREAGCEVSRDAVNNVIARVGGSGKKLLIVSHADEVAVIVRSITDDGFVLLQAGGGPRASAKPPYPMLAGQHCQIMTDGEPVPGIVGARTGHLRSAAGKDDEALTWDDIFVDIGAVSRSEVEDQGIHPGGAVMWTPPETRRLGHHIVGKAMDDRGALAIATEVARRADAAKLGYEVWLASTVQEEVGRIGADALGGGYNLAIALDVGLVGDVPGLSALEMPCRLGGGPALVHKDSGVRYHKDLTYALARTAREAEIPVQNVAYTTYFSDGGFTYQNGIPSALICYPTRYTHSPIETVNEGDLDATVRLLLAFCEKAPW